jgi:glycosyltransferase involved in cell wall biosynthesis
MTVRILMLSWEYPPHVVGGLGRHVAELVPALGTQGLEVHLVTPRWANGKVEEYLNGAIVYRVNPPAVEIHDLYTGAWQTNLKLEDKCEHLWEELGGFDVIHAHDWLVAFAACALKRNFKTPLMSTIHATERGRSRGTVTSDMQRAINNAEWWLTYESWRVICCSEYMAYEVREFFQVPSDKVDVVPNGVDIGRFEMWNGVDLTHFRNRYALPGEKIIFYVGRVVYEKGVHILVEAASRVLESYPHAKFVVAGTGDMLAESQHRAWELGIAHKVLFTGFIPDEERDRLFKVADCAVFPSLYEPFGIVTLEAMAAGAPVVVSEVGGLKEVVEHAETGITVYPNDVGSLTWGILHTLEHPQWTQTRVASARRKVMEEYNWTYISTRTSAIYKRIAQERETADW